jgi:CCT motif
MFGTNFIPENLEGYESGFMPNDVNSFFVPNFDGYMPEVLSKDFPNFPLLIDSEAIDPTNFMQMFDQAIQNLPEEIKQWIPMSFDYMVPPTLQPSPKPSQMLPKFSYNYSHTKIGTISVEERRIKVQRYLEKKKRRNFKKKISYMCRKKVADKRIRIKGRFVSKLQAEAILEENNNN